MLYRWRYKKRKGPINAFFEGKAALILLLSVAAFSVLLGPAGAVRAESAPDAPLVAYGDRVFYTVREGESLLSTALLTAGEEHPSGEALLELRDAIVGEMVNQAVMLLKYEELGLDDERPEDIAALEGNIEDAWDGAVRDMAGQLRSMYGGSEADSLETAKALLKQIGYTKDTVRDQVIAQWRSRRLAEAVAGDVSVSDREVELYYEQHYVTPDREKYADDIPAFERDVLYSGGTSCYMPEGYRMVKWIQLPLTAAETARIREAAEERDAAYQAAEEAYLATFGLFESDQALSLAQDAYSGALKQYGEAEEALAAAKREALAGHAGQTEEILAAYRGGTDWDDLIRMYSGDQTTADTPYPVHADSEMADQELKAAALSIVSAGGTADPVVTEAGIFLVCRAEDPQTGPVPMTGDVRIRMKELALQQKRQSRVDELLAGWRENTDVRSWPERLMLPKE